MVWKSDEKDHKKLNLLMTLNPNINIKSILASFDGQKDYWTMNGNISLSNTSLNINEAKICITNLDNNILLLPS